MPVTVSANSPETVVHKSSGGIAKTELDVCKTPTPGGPVPTPYVNVALSAQASECTRTVQCDGQPIMVKDSCFAVSAGDEPGSIGGIKSNVIKGKATPMNYSFDIKAEGRNVVRRSDPMQQNDGNTV